MPQQAKFRLTDTGRQAFKQALNAAGFDGQKVDEFVLFTDTMMGFLTDPENSTNGKQTLLLQDPNDLLEEQEWTCAAKTVFENQAGLVQARERLNALKGSMTQAQTDITSINGTIETMSGEVSEATSKSTLALTTAETAQSTAESAQATAAAAEADLDCLRCSPVIADHS